MLNALLSHPKRLVATLALVLAAAGVAVGSGATFTSSSASAANTFSSGTLTQSNSAANAAILSGSNLKPGQSVTGTATITNTGSLSGVFSLAEGSFTSSFTSAANLQLKVEDVTTASSPVTVYSGNLGAMGTKSLGTWAANEAHTYKFTVTLDQNASNAEQGKTASATFTWNATQA